ncbi:MAG: hypothetical protein R3A80_08325 [Bdellovibrionota bacterium]
MKYIKQTIFTVLFLSLSQGLFGIEHAVDGASLKRAGSPECKKQKDYSQEYEKAKPAFYALMAYLCDWSPPLLPWKITQFKGLWSKIASGKSTKLDDIKKYEALHEAKEYYDALSQKNDLPIISLSPSQALEVMSEQGDLSLLNSKQLNFYLKVFDCNLADANADSISGNAFAQLWNLDSNTGAATGLHQNAPAILQKILELEVEYQEKVSKKGNQPQAKACEEAFAASPLSIFSKAIIPRLDEELSVYPASQAAVGMRQALRALIPQVEALKNEKAKSQALASLSKIIVDVEKRFPEK